MIFVVTTEVHATHASFLQFPTNTRGRN